MFFYHLVIYFALDEVNPGTITFLQSTVTGLVLALLFGSINGILEVYIFKQKFKRLRFGYAVILKTILFISAFVVTVTAFILIKNISLVPIGLFETPETNELPEFFGSSVFFKHGLFAVLFSFGINFLLQIDNKMGKNVLLYLFIGKFHKPRKQNKIIMFLDLTSSTTIAEKIGDQKYSEFLKDFFFDLDEVITETRGSVYQYIGDEVVVHWDIKEGTSNNNCIRCYYESKKIITDEQEKYNKLYGFVPQFKAGIHLGEVVVTEVGGSKSEIAYHGDMINTASRLCLETKGSNNDLLISAELLSYLNDIDQNFRVESVGLVKFKGKQHDIAAFAVYEKSESQSSKVLN
jgi:adenylate cyclase